MVQNQPRWIDVALIAAVAALLVCGVFLFVENRELQQDARDNRRRIEKLKDWHIHVSSELTARGLDAKPVLTTESLESDDAQAPKPDRQEADE